MPARLTRTTLPYDFARLDPGQFEDLIYDLALRLPVEWIWLDPVGRAGADGGRDIHGLERGKGRGRPEIEWRFQVKRYSEISLPQLRKVVREAVPDKTNVPGHIVVAVAARKQTDAFDAVRDEATKLGALGELWSGETINGKLRESRNADLRSFYFGDGHPIDGRCASRSAWIAVPDATSSS